MSAKLLLLLGFVAALLVAALGVIWVPYEDTGLPEPGTYHLLALAVAVASVLLPFADAAWRAAMAQRGGAYTSIVNAYFLGASAVVTLTLLVGTYAGLSYSVFWTMQLIQYASLAIVLALGGHVGKTAGEREADADVVRHRKESAINDLESLSQRYPVNADADPSRVKVLRALNLLIEELRFLPNHGVGADALGIFGRTAKWKIAADRFLSTVGERAPEMNHPMPEDILTEAASISRDLSTWKN